MKTKDHVLVSKVTGHCRPVLLSCLALVLVCSLCALYLFAPLFFHEPEAQRFLDNIRQYIQLSVRAQKESDLIAFVCQPPRDYGTELYTVHPDGTHLRLVSSSISKTHYSLDWSLDGIWLAMNMKDEGHWSWIRHWAYESHHSEVYKTRFDGSVLKRLTYNRNDEDNPRWSNDGESILFDSGGLHSLSANGGEIKRINQLRRGSYSLSHSGLLLSIDHNHTGDPALDYTLHQDSSGLKLLVSPEAQIAFFNQQQWARNDEAFLYSDGYTGLAVFNMKTLLRVDIPGTGNGPARLSPDGKWLAVISIRNNNPAYGEWIRISDDGSLDDRSRRYLYLLDMATGRFNAFVQDINYVRIAWSPDSEWIAFVSAFHGGQLFKIKRDGTGLQQLTDLDCSISEISWSPK